MTAANDSFSNIRTNSKTTKSRKQKWEEKHLYVKTASVCKDCIRGDEQTKVKIMKSNKD